jgi:hypothetical protein
MRFAYATAAVLAACVPLGLLFLGCGSGGQSSGAACKTGGGADGGTCVPGTTAPYTSCADLTTPPVSFATDVAPVFLNSCAAAGSSCHGDPTLDEKTTGQVFLGYPPDAGMTATPAMILAGIVGQASPEDTTMDIVQAGDPGASYLMHKLDDDQCQFAVTCNATHNLVFSLCGLGMPYGTNMVLPEETRDTIRRWIAQGAQNN